MNKKIIIGLVIILIILSGIIFIQSNKNESNTFTVSGITETENYDLGFRVNGIMDKINIKEGDLVNKGTILASIDKDIYSEKKKIATADNDNAKIQLQELQKGNRPEEIKKAELELEKARANLEKISADFKRSKNLYSKKTISQQDFESMENAYKIADKSYKQMNLSLSLMKQGPRQEKILQAKAMVNKTRSLKRIAELEFSYTNLISPVSGIVNRIYSDTGENIYAGSPFISIIDTKNTWIKTYIPGNLLPKIKLGAEVNIKDDADNIRKGKISYISSQAEFTPKQVHTEDERIRFVYLVKITINNNDSNFKNGMPVTCIFNF